MAMLFYTYAETPLTPEEHRDAAGSLICSLEKYLGDFGEEDLTPEERSVLGKLVDNVAFHKVGHTIFATSQNTEDPYNPYCCNNDETMYGLVIDLYYTVRPLE